jgi:hypothetical protein
MGCAPPKHYKKGMSSTPLNVVELREKYTAENCPFMFSAVDTKSDLTNDDYRRHIYHLAQIAFRSRLASHGWDAESLSQFWAQAQRPYEGPKPSHDIEFLFRVEVHLSRAMRPLERIADLEKRLLASETANAELLKRLATIEKLLIC